jgi:hypothetical protein
MELSKTGVADPSQTIFSGLRYLSLYCQATNGMVEVIIIRRLARCHLFSD